MPSPKYPSNRLLTASIIRSASSGDTEAMYIILQHNDSYIVRLCTRPFTDYTGNTYYCVDEEMRNRLQIRLITRTLKFRLDYNWLLLHFYMLLWAYKSISQAPHMVSSTQVCFYCPIALHLEKHIRIYQILSHCRRWWIGSQISQHAATCMCSSDPYRL